ncbi:hypothetical protein MNBD_GAMMA01-554 [hydrothermal vent metagenome]|uniref:Uncharacterized protein n=1 Tax=hydrothermal vent metagenome TaxID=652676 RepID=A0A3B0VH79_9ZZZZ
MSNQNKTFTKKIFILLTMLISIGFLSIASANSPFAQNNTADSSSSITKSDDTDASEGKYGDEDAETSEEDSDETKDEDTEEDTTDDDEEKEEGKCGG